MTNEINAALNMLFGFMICFVGFTLFGIGDTSEIIEKQKYRITVLELCIFEWEDLVNDYQAEVKSLETDLSKCNSIKRPEPWSRNREDFFEGHIQDVLPAKPRYYLDSK